MPLSIYEIVIPPMIHGLGVMDDYVGRAERLAAAKQGSVERLLDVEIPDEESLSEIEASSRMRSPDLDSLTAGSGVCTPALLR